MFGPDVADLLWEENTVLLLLTAAEVVLKNIDSLFERKIN
jgi:hypothetical protein